MSAELLSAFKSLDQLNSWLRSESKEFFPPQIAIRKHVYWIKKKSVIDAHAHFSPDYKRVFVETKCRTCAGTGIFTRWDAHFYDEDEGGEMCRRCNGKGSVKLRFIEVNFQGIRWHIPQHDWYSASLEVNTGFDSFYPRDDCYVPAESWSTGLTGKPLATEEALAFAKHVFTFWRKEALFIISFHDNDPRFVPYDFDTDAWLDSAFRIGITK